MTQLKQEITLKPGPMWQGMSDDSAFSPAVGAFRTLKNCYISRDGTEIRRMPPLTKFAEPVMSTTLGPLFDMIPGDPETTIRIDPALAGPHRLHYSGSSNTHRIYVSGNSAIADGWYLCRASDASDPGYSLTIAVATTIAATNGVFFVEAATRAVGMRMIGDKLAIVAETEHGDGIAAGTSRQCRAVAAFIQKVPLDHLAPFGGSGTQFEYWYSAVNQPVSMSVPIVGVGPGPTYTLFNGPNGWATVGTIFSWRDDLGFLRFGTVTAAYTQFSVPSAIGASVAAIIQLPGYDRPARRRCQLDVADGRLLIAIPGEGVLMSAQASAYDSDLSYATKYTRLLGVPKGVLTNGATGVTSSNTADGALTPGETYQVAIGYKDRRTGEVGLISEIVEKTLGGSDDTLTIQCLTPRAVLREAYDLGIVVYLSDAGGTAGSLRPVLETNAAGNLVQHDYSVVVHALIDLERRVPDIEQMPMGGSIVRTIKGTTHVGGLIGPVAEAPNLASLHIGTDWNAVSQTQIALQPDSPASGATTVVNSPCADGEVPPSFAGMPISYSDLPQAVLDKRVNGVAPHLHVWELRSMHPVKLVASDQTALLFYPRGQGWYGERGFPGVSPAINRLIYDRATGYDLTGYGRYADSLIACTDRETYIASWDRSPSGVDPHMVDGSYGCIAASSMVQFDGGCAWLSAQGPVALAGGGVDWIGKPIAKTFQSFKRDSRGMMTHAFSAHDTERKLVLFFVRADRNSTAYEDATTDDARSKISCDTVLVWSYSANAWSYWELPAAFECVDAEMVLCSDGIMRMGILTETGLSTGTRCVYCFDEELRETIVEPGTQFDMEMVLKLGALNPEGRLEHGAKVGAINIRHETSQPVTGAIAAGFISDDTGTEYTIDSGRAASNTRTRLSSGAVRAQDAQVRVRIAGVGKMRVKDITLEVSPGG